MLNFLAWTLNLLVWMLVACWPLSCGCADMWVALANVLPLSAGEEWNIVRDNVSEELLP